MCIGILLMLNLHKKIFSRIFGPYSSTGKTHLDSLSKIAEFNPCWARIQHLLHSVFTKFVESGLNSNKRRYINDPLKINSLHN